jgi:hypothetical protein
MAKKIEMEVCHPASPETVDVTPTKTLRKASCDILKQAGFIR